MDVTIAIICASYSGNKGAAAMLQSSIQQLYNVYGNGLNIKLMSVYPEEDEKQIPFEFIEVVSCTPQQLLFIAFPLAILYNIFRWCTPIKKIIERNKIIKSYKETDLVIDEAGISFVDSRGFVMNAYAMVTNLVPMLLSVPVVKYSQALGEFNNIFNKLFAKITLPKVKLICARGEITKQNLKSIGIEKNVIVCADGAFSMEDDIETKKKVNELCDNDDFYSGKVVALSVSSVVEKKCRKYHINYVEEMVTFSKYLIDKGYGVLIIANAARIDSEKPRNNDLMVCREVYQKLNNTAMVRWYDEEMTAEKIRELIARSEVLVASRFHAMIGGLYKKTPVLLIGWSHKYKEVLDMFQLGEYAVDYSKLSFDLLISSFEKVMSNQEIIRESIEKNLEKVKESSYNNINQIIKEVNISHNSNNLIDLHNTKKYLGTAIKCRMGYSSNEDIRKNASSGGMITSLLCSLLRQGKIDGAWVTRGYIENGELCYNTGIATTEDEIRACSSSIYMDIPLLKHIEEIKKFHGKIAVVLVPCQMRAFQDVLEKDSAFNERVVLKISLYCSGQHDSGATYSPLKNAKVSLEKAEKLIYKNGHWRGNTVIIMRDGTTKSISYTKTICAYKNAYFYSRKKCMVCQDQFGYQSDMSFGDIWLREMKKNPIKHTSVIIRNEKSLELYRSAVEQGDIIDFHISKKKVVLSQKRALAYKWNCAKAKKEHYDKVNQSNMSLDVSSKCRWNHRLAFWLSMKNQRFSEKNPRKLEKTPNIFIFIYMCFIRTLLSF